MIRIYTKQCVKIVPGHIFNAFVTYKIYRLKLKGLICYKNEKIHPVDGKLKRAGIFIVTTFSC